MDALEALVARADAADRDYVGAAPGGAQGAPDGGAHANVAQEIAFLLSAVSKIAAPLLPSVSAIYTEEACQAIAAELEPVCLKRGWLQGDATAAWAPEVRALLCVVPLSVATYQALLHDVNALRAKRPAPEPAPMDEGQGDAKPAADRPRKVEPVE